tara:strand:+ start:2322 stop:2591 length:270 start_codon:yes stop_codon:yes gene_type:complete
LVNQLNSPDIFGFIAAVLTTIAFIPQLIKTFRTKSADDVSIVMLAMFITGVSFWIVYGWEIHSTPILVANIITFALNFSILILKLSYQP